MSNAIQATIAQAEALRTARDARGYSTVSDLLRAALEGGTETLKTLAAVWPWDDRGDKCRVRLESEITAELRKLDGHPPRGRRTSATGGIGVLVESVG
jgi:hypothetical protein